MQRSTFDSSVPTIDAQLNSFIAEAVENGDQPMMLMSSQYALPNGYKYHVVSDDLGMVEIRADICESSQAELWVRKFQDDNKLTYRVDNGKVAKCKVNAYKRNLKCQHKTRPRT